MGSIGEIVIEGNLLLAAPIALLAGLVSFLSPCILPLVPGYLGYIGGATEVGETDAERRRARKRLLLGVALFVLGFTVVFVLFGVLFGVAGLLLKPWMELITRIAGVVIIVMGLVFMGRFGALQRTIKPKWTAATGLAGAPFLGIVFGLGWVPCLGPTLVAVMALSLDGGSAGRGALLAFLYCLGLGIPFLLVAIGFGWVAGSVSWVKRHIRLINLIGGGLLVLVGLAMVTGLWSAFISNFGAVIGSFVPAL